MLDVGCSGPCSPALGWIAGQIARNEIIHLPSQSHAEEGLVVGVWQVEFKLLCRVNDQAVRFQLGQHLADSGRVKLEPRARKHLRILSQHAMVVTSLHCAS